MPCATVTRNAIDNGRKQVKNAGRVKLIRFSVLYGGNMKNRARMILIGVPVVLVAGLLLSGCKPEPELTQASAKALIQAKYDQTPPVGINVVVDELGFREGYTAKYWDRIKVYPNQFWADFKLTPEGKKAFKLPNGGDVIEWRPESADDKGYSVIVVTVAAIT